jgi:hypothetical protein
VSVTLLGVAFSNRRVYACSPTTANVATKTTADRRRCLTPLRPDEDDLITRQEISQSLPRGKKYSQKRFISTSALYISNKSSLRSASQTTRVPFSREFSPHGEVGSTSRPEVDKRLSSYTFIIRTCTLSLSKKESKTLRALSLSLLSSSLIIFTLE